MCMYCGFLCIETVLSICLGYQQFRAEKTRLGFKTRHREEIGKLEEKDAEGDSGGSKGATQTGSAKFSSLCRRVW